jgi:two-component system, OmpR family, KDP operon response regulator KdpE
MIEFMACVLMMDDKESIHRLLRTSLGATEYADVEVGSDEEVLATVTVSKSNRIALNLGLANGKEVTLAGQLRDKSKIPVILLAVHDQEKVTQAIPTLVSDGAISDGVVSDGAVAFANGQYLEAQSLMATDGLLATSTSVSDESIFRVRDLSIDKARRVVRRGKEIIHLTPTEYELLCLLATQAGAVLSHEKLMLSIWGVKNAHSVHLLRVNISNLRRKLERDPATPTYLITEPGIGYRLWSES